MEPLDDEGNRVLIRYYAGQIAERAADVPALDLKRDAERLLDIIKKLLPEGKAEAERK